jgi:uracil-DNA glycosylase family 4
MAVDGDGSSGVMLMAEALGEREAEVGKPFVGRAGQLLNTALERAGIPRSSLTVINAAWCWPPKEGRNQEAPSWAAIQHCKKAHWDQVIRERKPRVIVALGKIAIEVLTGELGELEGLRGYPIWNNGYKAWIIPTYHPSYIQRGNFNEEPLVIHDLQRAIEIADQGYKPRWGRYVIDPPSEVAWAWARKAATQDGPLAFDGEWDRKTKKPTRWSFSREAWTGMSVPATSEYLPIIRFLLENDWEKSVWNRPADVPILRTHHGIEVGGLIHDSMVAWHILHTDLPKGLDVVASVVCPDQPRWAHLSDTQGGMYNAIDSDVTRRIHLRVMEELTATGRSHVYHRHVVALDKRLAKMSRKGMPVDNEKKLAAAIVVEGEIARLTSEMAKAIPAEIRPATPKHGYIRAPKDITSLVIREYVDKDGKPVTRYAKLAPLKISPQLILKYQKYHGHAWMMKREPGGAPKPTTDYAAMVHARLKWPEDPIYRNILQTRKFSFIRGTFLGRVDAKGQLTGGLPINPSTGCVHTTFNHNPSTLRVATEDPGLQNLPRPEDDMAALVRGIFVAPAGWQFMARDFKGIEAVVTGYVAGSRAMTYLASMDIHTYNTVYWKHAQGEIPFIDLPQMSWAKGDLEAALAKFKKRWPLERQGIKVQTHAMNYLAKPKEIQEILLTELEWVAPIKEIKRFYDFYRELFPEIPTFHRNLVAAVEGIEEHEFQGLSTGIHWVQNPFGYLHHFYHCAQWEKIGDKWQWGLGPTATDLAAFPGQSIAAGIAKEAILRLELEEPELVEELRLFIHDELLGMWPMELAERVQAALKRVMEQPIPELPLPESWGLGSHLQILTDGKQGADWGHMEEI